ncbi:MAG: O-antigen ligase family protein [Bacteroidota bacterium]
MDISPISEKYRNISKDISFFALLLVASSLFFSRFLISIGFILVVFNWIVEGGFKEKFGFIKKNKSAFYILLLWVFHLIGLVYTQNLEDGIFDIRTKSFLFIIPAYGSGIYLSKKRKNIVLHVYILSALVASIIGSLNFYIGNEFASIEDLGGMSLVGGNLYQAILINFAISLLCFFLIFKKKTKYAIIYYLFIFWFFVYLFLLNSLTGYVLLFVLFIYNSFYLFLKLKTKRSKLKILSILFIIIGSISIYIGIVVIDFYKSDKIAYNQLPNTTINGNIYIQDTTNRQLENGHYLYLNFCEKELLKEWNSRSTIAYNGLDKKHQQISQTLIRYLSSKNFAKDSMGVWTLSSDEIQLIENGCANYLYAEKFSPKARIYVLLWQLDSYFNNDFANRQTISQRLVYFKVAFELIKNHFWTGVGPGDVLDESKNWIATRYVGLSQEYSSRVHNQFLVEFVGLGILGFIGFIFIIFYPFLKNKMWKDYLLTSFYLIVISGFFSDNLFESQLGIAFFALFYSLLYFKNEN